MEKVSLKEKQQWISEMSQIVWANSTVDAKTKGELNKQIMLIIGQNLSKEELASKKNDIIQLLMLKKKETVEKITNNLIQPTKLPNVSDIKNIDTLNRPNGQVITSVQKNDGSIYVKDSSFSGDINKMVEEVASKNIGKNLTQEELTKQAFDEMERRQIVINMTDPSKTNMNSQQINSLNGMTNSNKVQVNQEYNVMVDGNNNLYDLSNSSNKSNVYQNSDDQMVNEKPKVKTYTIKNNTFSDAAFVDAALVGLVTFYAGVLGLCSIFSQM